MLNHTGIAVLLWHFRMGLNNDDFLSFETRLHLGQWLGILFPGSYWQYFAANGDRLNSQVTKLLHELTKICTIQLYQCSLPDRLTCQTLL